MDLAASFKDHKQAWIAGGVVVAVLVFVWSKKASAATGGATSKTPLAWTFGQSAHGSGQASVGPTQQDLVPLSDPTHVFTVGEVQYLLNLWGSSPLPPQTGTYDDTTDLAIRDFQTRGGVYGPMDVTGDPFDIGTSRALQNYAASLLASGSPITPSGGITYSDVQTLLGLPVTGILDSTTQARLNQYSPNIGVPAPITLANPSVASYFTTMAKQARLWPG